MMVISRTKSREWIETFSLPFISLFPTCPLPLERVFFWAGGWGNDSLPHFRLGGEHVRLKHGPYHAVLGKKVHHQFRRDSL